MYIFMKSFETFQNNINLRSSRREHRERDLHLCSRDGKHLSTVDWQWKAVKAKQVQLLSLFLLFLSYFFSGGGGGGCGGGKGILKAVQNDRKLSFFW